MTRTIVAACCAALIAGASAAADPLTLVACAPGYPGSTEQAQPTMDALAARLAEAAGWPAGRLAAEYHESLEPGLARLRAADAAVALVPLAFYLRYADELDLHPIAEVADSRAGGERWSLVAARGAVSKPADLADMTVEAVPGYAPAFVRRVALGEWGALPASTGIAFTGRVLSSLRRASRGEPVAVLLDEEQAAALDALPFGDSLEVVARSAGLPASLVCAVDDRLGADDAAALAKALRALGATDEGRDVLAEIRVPGFRAVDEERLAAVTRRYAGGPDASR